MVVNDDASHSSICITVVAGQCSLTELSRVEITYEQEEKLF